MFSQSSDNVARALAHPAVMVGSDSLGLTAGPGPHPGKPHPRMYGTFPRVLGEFARERKLFSLETAVYKMTGMPAARLRLRDRGLLRPGFAAEVRLLQERPPVETSPAAPLVQTTLRIAQQRLGRTLTPGGVPYGTDGSVYAPLLGIPMVICGPGRAELAHQPDEHVEIADLRRAIGVMALGLLNLWAQE